MGMLIKPNLNKYLFTYKNTFLDLQLLSFLFFINTVASCDNHIYIYDIQFFI